MDGPRPGKSKFSCARASPLPRGGGGESHASVLCRLVCSSLWEDVRGLLLQAHPLKTVQFLQVTERDQLARPISSFFNLFYRIYDFHLIWGRTAWRGSPLTVRFFFTNEINLSGLVCVSLSQNEEEQKSLRGWSRSMLCAWGSAEKITLSRLVALIEAFQRPLNKASSVKRGPDLSIGAQNYYMAIRGLQRLLVSKIDAISCFQGSFFTVESILKQKNSLN